MSLRHFIIRLRMFFTILIVTVILSVIGGLIYLHEKGFSKEAGDRVAAEMERYGVYAEFDNLSFHLIRGLTANNVSFYQTAKREIKIAQLPSIAIHVDKSKLMRGILKVNTISIENATLSLPLVQGRKGIPIVEITNVTGTIDLPNKQSVRTTNLSGKYQGVHIALNCNIWRSSTDKKQELDPEHTQRLVNNYLAFLDHMKQWSWTEESPPTLKLFIEGDIAKSHKLDFSFELDAPAAEFKSYTFNNLTAKGDWGQHLITFDHLTFTNNSEPCTLTADFDTKNLNGRFKAESSIDLRRFVRKVFGKQILKQFTFIGKTRIDTTGRFQLPKSSEEKIDLTMMGKVHANDFSFKGASIHDLKSDFSWNNGDLYLDKLSVQHALGTLAGRIIIKDRKIRYQATTSLPAKAYFPFIRSQALKKGLAELTFTKDSHIDVTSTGVIDQDNPKIWKATGSGHLKDFSYRGTPIKALQSDYKMSRSEATFDTVSITFDYSDYILQRTYRTAPTGTVTAKSLYFKWKERYLNIDKLRGSVWPAPLLRMFTPSVADHLETYKFHLPPTLSSSGTVSWNKKTSNTTNLKIGFTSTGDTEYPFLKKDVTLSQLKGQVTVLPNKVLVNSLSTKTFGGDLSGYIHVIPSNSKYSGRFAWNALQLPQISKTYDFEKNFAGNITGSFKFHGKGSKVSTLNGSGSTKLANGDLFDFPLFGPLSSLVNGVLKPFSKQRVLHENARGFTATYLMKKGTILTKNLVAKTNNTTFTGEGWVDLNTETLDFTIRMNFRGLMGIAEVPIKLLSLPFQAFQKVTRGEKIKGLKQFRGTGSIEEPQWRFAPFSPPSDRENDPLFKN